MIALRRDNLDAGVVETQRGRVVGEELDAGIGAKLRGERGLAGAAVTDEGHSDAVARNARRVKGDPATQVPEQRRDVLAEALLDAGGVGAADDRALAPGARHIGPQCRDPDPLDDDVIAGAAEAGRRGACFGPAVQPADGVRHHDPRA